MKKTLAFISLAILLVVATTLSFEPALSEKATAGEYFTFGSFLFITLAYIVVLLPSLILDEDF